MRILKLNSRDTSSPPRAGLQPLVFPCLSPHYLLRKPFLQHYYTRRTLIVWRAQRIHTWRAQRIRAGSRKPNGPQTYYYFLIAYFQS